MKNTNRVQSQTVPEESSSSSFTSSKENFGSWSASFFATCSSEEKDKFDLVHDHKTKREKKL